MTLGIAWKNPTEILVASDSRVTIGDRIPVDTVAKISVVHARVYPARAEGESKPSPVFEQGLGILAAGSTLAIGTTRELLRALLPELMVPSPSDLRLERICEAVAELFGAVSRRVCKVMLEDGLSEFLLFGWCPVSDRARAFHFTITPARGELSASFKEVLTDSDIHVIGSGSTAAKAILATDRHMDRFRVLHKVIDDEGVPTVGGPVQAGHLTKSGFQLYGIQDFTVDEKSRKISTYIAFAGHAVYPIPLPAALPFRQTFLHPFDQLIDDFLSAGYSISADL